MAATDRAGPGAGPTGGHGARLSLPRPAPPSVPRPPVPAPRAPAPPAGARLPGAPPSPRPDATQTPRHGRVRPAARRPGTRTPCARGCAPRGARRAGSECARPGQAGRGPPRRQTWAWAPEGARSPCCEAPRKSRGACRGPGAARAPPTVYSPQRGTAGTPGHRQGSLGPAGAGGLDRSRWGRWSRSGQGTCPQPREELEGSGGHSPPWGAASPCAPGRTPEAAGTAGSSESPAVPPDRPEGRNGRQWQRESTCLGWPDAVHVPARATDHLPRRALLRGAPFCPGRRPLRLTRDSHVLSVSSPGPLHRHPMHPQAPVTGGSQGCEGRLCQGHTATGRWDLLGALCPQGSALSALQHRVTWECKPAPQPALVDP